MEEENQPPAWEPSLSPKQKALIAMCHPNIGKPRYVLVSGPRKSGKSVGCHHAVCDHAWNVHDAKISILCPTITAGDDQGFWTLLTERYLPMWIDADFGMKWVKMSRTKGVSRKLYCQVTNKFGGISTIQLDSLQYEHEVEGRFKNKQHSMVYVSEASYYRKRKTFDIIKEVLRGEQWNESDFLMLLDTNPAEEGTEHWLWEMFYNYRLLDGLTGPEKSFQRQLALLEIMVPDNPFISQEEKDRLFAEYGHSDDLMARYYYGKWVKAHGNSIFFEQWRPNTHIRGEFETATNPDPEILLPQPNCFMMRTGWDIGDINHSFHVCDVFDMKRKFKGKDGKEIEGVVKGYQFLDEVVYIGLDSSLYDYMEEVMEKVLFWEKHLGRELNWINWSDRSAFDRKEPIQNIRHHIFVRNVSEQMGRRLILQAAARGQGSVKQRIDIVKRVLFEKRIWVCRSRCPHLIDSFQSLPSGRGNSPVDRASKFKHSFDSASYIIASEESDNVIDPKNQANEGRARGGLVSVPL